MEIERHGGIVEQIAIPSSITLAQIGYGSFL